LDETAFYISLFFFDKNFRKRLQFSKTFRIFASGKHLFTHLKHNDYGKNFTLISRSRFGYGIWKCDG
jgi:hypothetical protein